MIGDKIRELREDNCMTQEQLSNALGININTLASYERNMREPKIDTILKFSNYFNVTTDYLLGISDYRNFQEQEETGVPNDKNDNEVSQDKDSQSYWALALYRKAKPIFNKINQLYYPKLFLKSEETHLCENLYKQIVNILDVYEEAVNSVEDNNLNPFSEIVSNFVLQHESKTLDAKAILELAGIYYDLHGQGAHL